MWQHSIHMRNEIGIVAALQQVNHLVDDNELKTGMGFLGQFEVYRDAPRTRIATSPPGSHPANGPLGDIDADLRFPLRHEFWDVLAQQAPIPLVEHILSICAAGLRWDSHFEPRIRSNSNASLSVSLDDIQPVAPSMQVVSLAGHHLSLRLANLLLESTLLPPNPPQAGHHCKAHGVVV
jgi:hypothetical protein